MKTPNVWVFLVLTIMMANLTSSAQNHPAPSFTDLDYTGNKNPRQTLDLYIPTGFEGALPVVVYIHGGAWLGGNKGHAMNYADALFAAGYIIADITYRLSQEAPWPAQIQDCKAAIRYLKRHADRFKLDRDRIGVMGHSAGGHLAAMLACSHEEASLEISVNNDKNGSSTVAAAIDFFGPTNFSRMNQFPPDPAWNCRHTIDHDDAESPEGLLLGCAPPDCPDRVASADPATYIKGNEPPIWLVHGTKDCLVPTDQSQYLHQRLQEAGSNSKLTLLEGAGHGGEEYTSPEMKRQIRAFFDHHLKPVSEELPNIVLLIGDDQGYPYFGFMGADYVQTSNMDALAGSGTLFTNGYVPANHCRPSLQSLMTGTLPIDYEREVSKLIDKEWAQQADASGEDKKEWDRNFRHHAMKHFTTLPKRLSSIGYSSFQGGKWWEFNYQNGGFTEGMTTGWTQEDRKVGGKWFKKFMGGTGLELARATMEPVYDFIDENPDQPFFIWYAPELPHYPFDAPEKYYDLYKDKDMTESAKRYYANCTWFDDGVGELIRYLKEKEEYENTLFIYVNDNGWEQNPDQEFRADSMRWHNGGDKGKLSMYDQSFRTPIIFSWDGKITSGIVKNDLMHSADIPATILDYLGLAIPENYFGQSYKDVIEGKSNGPREEVIGNINQIRSEDNMMGKRLEGYWLRNKDWFFNWDVPANIISLYDIKNDPFNNHDLSAKHPDIVAELSAKIAIWKKEKGR